MSGREDQKSVSIHFPIPDARTKSDAAQFAGEDEPKGVWHTVSDEQLAEYASWPYTRRLDWLMARIRLRNALPPHIRERQDRFRRGEL